MLTWKAINADCDDETRQATFVRSFKYEVVTAAYLEPSEKVKTLPPLFAIAAWNHLAVVLDASLFIFTDGCSDLLMQLTLNDTITKVFWLPQGEFLVLVDSCNIIHCVHIKTESVFLTKKLNLEPSEAIIAGDCYLSEEGLACITLITSYGHIYRISNIDVANLIEALIEKDMQKLMSEQGSLEITCSSIPLPNNEELLKSAHVFSGFLEKEIIVYAVSLNGLIIWYPVPLFNDCSESVQFTSFMKSNKILPIFNNRYCAVLCEDGTLNIICSFTGITVWNELKNVLNVELHPVNDDQIIVIHRNVGENELLIFSLSEFNAVFTLSVPKYAKIVHCGQESESVCFIEPCMEGDFYINLKVKSIVDCIPEVRLAKFLNKKKFKEAEECCATFNLDVEEVRKSRAVFMCSLLDPWRAAPNNTTFIEYSSSNYTLQELCSALQEISDVEFITNLCLESPMPNLDITKALFNFAKEKISQIAMINNEQKCMQLMQRIGKSMLRLTTFISVWPSSDILQWLSFVHVDMLEEFMAYVQRGNLDCAAIIWHRHNFEFYGRIDEIIVKKILFSMPLSLSSSYLSRWLPKHMLKDIIQFCPSSLDVIADWTIQRVRDLEAIEADTWPDNALLLTNAIIGVLDNMSTMNLYGVDSEVQMAISVAQWKAHSPSSSLHYLRDVPRDLNDLAVLIDKYRIKIKYRAYIQDEKQIVVSSLLDWTVYGDDIKIFINGFLKPYFITYELDCDQSLSTYVRETLDSYNIDWWEYQEAPWEEKLYAIIYEISDVKIRCECILSCLQVAPVPWSLKTSEICDYGISLNTTLTENLRNQKNSVALKLVLGKYSLHMVTANNPRTAELIIRVIVSQAKENIVEDALTVASFYKHVSIADVFYFYALHLLSVGNYRELLKIISIQKKRIQVNICQKLFIYVEEKINYTLYINEKDKQSVCLLLKTFLFIENILKQNIEESNCSTTYLNKLEDIKSLYKLQTVYGIYINMNDLHCSNTCQDTMRWYMLSVYNDVQNNLKSTVSNDDTCLKYSQRLHRLSKLLRLSDGIFYSTLIVFALQRNKVLDAIAFVRLFIHDYDVENADYLIVNILKAVTAIYREDSLVQKEQSKEHIFKMNFVNAVYDLLCQHLLFLRIDNLCFWIDVSLWCLFFRRLFDNCYMSNSFSISITNADDYKLNYDYSDVIMPLEENLVSKSFSQSLESFICSYESELPYMQCLSSVVKPDYLYSLFMHLQQRMQYLNGFLLSTICSFMDCKDDKLMCNYTYISSIIYLTFINKNSDCCLCLSFLSLLSVEESLTVVDDLVIRAGRNYSQLNTAALIGLDICYIYNLCENTSIFESLSKNARWDKKLSIRSINVKNVISETLDDITKSPNCDMSLICDYCKDYGIEPAAALLKYFHNVLHSIQFASNDFNLSLHSIFSGELSRTSLLKLISHIEISCLNSFLWDELISASPYCYEVVELLICYILYTSQKGDDETVETLKTADDVIQFLKKYKRCSQPLDCEIESWAEKFSATEMPLISKERLPFHEFFFSKKNTREIIKQELDVNTLESWLMICPLINLNLDNICMIAVQTIVSSTLQSTQGSMASSSGKKIWNVWSTSSALLNTVKGIISKIKNDELRTACANWVVNQLPQGVDKVNAAVMCKQIAKEWNDKNRCPFSIKGFQNTLERYQHLSIEHILVKYNLSEANYLSCIKDPATLVINLYQHPALDSLDLLQSVKIPDINACAKEICSVTKSEIMTIQLDILERWLFSYAKSFINNEETIVNFCLTKRNSKNVSYNVVRLSKIIYLLRSFPKSVAISYLLEKIYSDDKSISSVYRHKALQCLLAIADPSEIEKIGSISFTDLRLHYQTLTYVTELELINHVATPQQFATMDKQALVEGLWHSQYSNSSAVILIANLCCDFKIHISSLWHSILSQFIKFLTTEQLECLAVEKILIQMRKIPELWLIPSFADAWKAVILYPFRKGTLPMNEKGVNDCIHSVDILLRHCPISLDVSCIVQFALSLDLYVLALTVADIDRSSTLNIQDLMEILSEN